MVLRRRVPGVQPPPMQSDIEGRQLASHIENATPSAQAPQLESTGSQLAGRAIPAAHPDHLPQAEPAQERVSDAASSQPDVEQVRVSDSKPVHAGGSVPVHAPWGSAPTGSAPVPPGAGAPARPQAKLTDESVRSRRARR